MKLIKINTDHYVVVDDSEIKEGDWYYWEITKTIQIAKLDSLNRLPKSSDGSKKITHSTQPFNNRPHFAQYGLITLSEVKELIGEVDIWQKFKEIDGSCQKGEYEHWLFESGYNQALEDNKEKKYTEEDVIRIVEKSRETGLTAEYLLLSLQPKTEWEVEFIDGKLKLK
jgi:hypothetical protein